MYHKRFHSQLNESRTAVSVKVFLASLPADAMAFSGPAPEAINGRLAMLAFVAAVGAELASNVTTVDQFKSAPVPVFVAFAVFTVASLIPILSGADLKKTSGPFTPLAEVRNHLKDM